MVDPVKDLPRKAIPYLTRIVHGSAPFITTFLLIHLTSPAIASLGGSSLSSQTMLLGREYYQTGFGEKYLVLGPIAVHTLSSLTKRLIIGLPKKRPSLLTMTGYATMFFFLPVHFLTHRLFPMSDTFPINALGPSELDYEYVKYGLTQWPWKSWFLYFGLVVGVSCHAVEGTRMIYNTWMAGGPTESVRLAKKSPWRKVAMAALAIPVLSGVFVLSKEPMMVLSSTAKRFDASFKAALLYRL